MSEICGAWGMAPMPCALFLRGSHAVTDPTGTPRCQLAAGHSGEHRAVTASSEMPGLQWTTTWGTDFGPPWEQHEGWAYLKPQNVPRSGGGEGAAR